jgi:hypothetical protein
MQVQLDSIVPWGRSFDEYVRMFALTERDLSRSIIDCAAGPSSFNAEMHQRGRRVVSVDPIYEFSADQIRSRVQAVRDTMIDQVREQRERFIWDYIRSPEHLEEMRLGAMEMFLRDFSPASRDRYVAAALPNLPTGNFDLALCSHFLFLYSDRLDANFHIESIRAMLQVAEEVRVFPVKDLAGATSPHLQPVQENFATKLVRVPYEFLRGANEMLVVTQNPPPRI